MSERITLTFAGDESGDVSFSFGKGATRYFVMAMIATDNAENLRGLLARLRQDAGLPETYEFGFHALSSARLRERTFDALSKAGSGLGSGAVIVMDDTTCMVRACERIARFYHMESCGQCTPCRHGTGWMHRMLQRIVAGEGREGDLELLRSAAGQIEGHTICAFGEAAAWPVQGFLRHYWDEFEFYVKHGRSLVEEQQGLAA